jgi:sugar fermentation stimulation protein A
MNFDQQLIPAILIRRYKRFLADVELRSGEKITVHCPNSGSMRSCINAGWDVLLNKSENKKRKYRYTWEMIHNGRCWIGINTAVPNRISLEAIQNGRISELAGYSDIYREKKYGKNSRIDILLESANKKCFVEIKNVTLVEDDGNYYFPDAVTERGKKHLYELRDMVREGHRAVMLFVVQRNDGLYFKAARHIDQEYSTALEICFKDGVEIIVYRADVSPEKIEIAEKIEWKRD